MPNDWCNKDRMEAEVLQPWIHWSLLPRLWFTSQWLCGRPRWRCDTGVRMYRRNFTGLRCAKRLREANPLFHPPFWSWRSRYISLLSLKLKPSTGLIWYSSASAGKSSEVRMKLTSLGTSKKSDTHHSCIITHLQTYISDTGIYMQSWVMHGYMICINTRGTVNHVQSCTGMRLSYTGLCNILDIPVHVFVMH